MASTAKAAAKATANAATATAKATANAATATANATASTAKAALQKLGAFWDYCYRDEENRMINYRVRKAGALFVGSIFLIRTFGDRLYIP